METEIKNKISIIINGNPYEINMDSGIVWQYSFTDCGEYDNEGWEPVGYVMRSNSDFKKENTNGK